MVLLLVTHVVDVPSSRVPLACIIISDAIKRKSLPPNLKCRMVIPSCSNYSASLWDASCVDDLQQWIDTNLMDGIAHVAEIPEEFTYGLALELTTARAADKVAKSSKNTLDRINNTGARVIETMAEKLDRLDQRTHLISATREVTSAAVDKMKAATDRALESEGVQKSIASISSSLQTASKGMGRAFTWVGNKVKESFPANNIGPGGQSYAAFGADSAAPSAPPYDAAVYSPAAAFMPVSTHALGRSSPEGEDTPMGAGQPWGTGAGAPAEDNTPMPQFTLQDGVGSPHFIANDAAYGLRHGPGDAGIIGESIPLVRSPGGTEAIASAPPMSAPAPFV